MIAHRILPRSLWNAIARKWRVTLPTHPVRTVYLHHGASGDIPDAWRDLDGDGVPDYEEAIWRSYQRFHMVNRRWSDIAYNFGAGQSGSILEGRGWRVQGGATGSPDDASSLSICAIGNFDKVRPTPALLEAIAQWLAQGVRRGDIHPKFELKGHRDKPYGTNCPGRYLYPEIAGIRARVDQILNGEDETMDTAIDKWYPHIRDAADGTKDEAMRVWQLRLVAWGFLDLSDVDGVKGPATRAAHAKFEEFIGAQNPNGRPGAVSWAKLLEPPTPKEVIPADLKQAVLAAAAVVRDFS